MHFPVKRPAPKPQRSVLLQALITLSWAALVTALLTMLVLIVLGVQRKHGSGDSLVTAASGKKDPKAKQRGKNSPGVSCMLYNLLMMLYPSFTPYC